MEKTNMDGIRRPKLNPALAKKPKITVKVIHQKEEVTSQLVHPIKKKSSGKKYRITNVRNIYYPKLPIVITAFFMLSAFAAGMWYNMQTKNIKADNEDQVATSVPAGFIPLSSTANDLGNISSVPDSVLFNLPLEQLETYMNNLGEKTAQEQKEWVLTKRAEKIKELLQEHDSPFVQYVDLIAKQEHWKLILAISFSESTLGKHCYTNNCSGIGVAPGHPFWREYKSVADWIVDFNKLLDKKYKNWTLEEMDGVYVQPRSDTWLAAAKQILSEIQAKQIE